MKPNEIIKALEPGKFTRLLKVSPAGSLEARLEKGGWTRFYWRGAFGKKTVRISIGLFDRTASPRSIQPTTKGYSITAAEQAATVIAAEHIQHRDEGGIAALRQERKAQAQQAQQAKAEAAKHTLKSLMIDYCDHLEALGRDSYRDARSIFENHVTVAFPKIASMQANEVTPEDVADMMRRLVEMDKRRTANKLRSYLRAAFETAKRSRMDATVPLRFKAYNVRVNPAADTLPDAAGNRSAKNPLMQDDIRIYWRAIKDLPGLHGAVLRFHLLTGGQRIAQLVRLKADDVERDWITLYDSKGRPGAQPRPHLIPLTDAARQALNLAHSGGEYVFSTDGGQTHIAPTTLSKWAQVAAGDDLPGFTAKRIRSGVETLLSARGFSKEVRGRLQSHGIAGVQDRHYDGHDYLPQKKQALKALYEDITLEADNVVSIHGVAV